MTRTLNIGFAPILAALCAAAPHSAAAFSYSALDLGTLGGPNSLSGFALTANGQAVGQADLSGGGYQAFLTAPNSALVPGDALGTLPGGSISVGFGVNDLGQVAGFADTSRSTADAFVSSGGTLNDLGTFGGTNSVAEAINDAGTVVGGADTANGSSHAFVHSGTGPLTAADDIGTLGGDNGAAYAINANEQVVGSADIPNGDTHAFLYSGTGGLVVTDDLGTLAPGNAGSSIAFGLNAAGDVVGQADTGTGVHHAFLYVGGSLIDLGTLPGDLNSNANGINDRGFIVGESDSATPGYLGATAFLDTGSGVENLNALIAPGLGYTLTNANAINDNGQILADGYNLTTGQGRAFLLTPIAVPEPSPLAVLGLGLLGVGFAAARRRA